jgi:hypothetical protein
LDAGLAAPATPGSLRPGKQYRRFDVEEARLVTVSREQPGPPGQTGSRLLRDRRLVQATWATCVAISASAIPDIWSERWRNLPPLLVGLAAMAWCWPWCAAAAATARWP